MFTKIKVNVAVIAVALTLVSFTVLTPETGIFGRSFNPSQDFTCCKGNQLYIHHYYQSKIFWIKIGSGYTEEAIGKPTEGCNVQCAE